MNLNPRTNPIWRRLRRNYIRSHPFCENCGVENLVEAKDVHHILPLRERPDLAFEPSNLKALCEPCHVAAHAHDRPNCTASAYRRKNTPVSYTHLTLPTKA